MLYLIPANSKRSMLILGMFAPIDLIIFGVGAGLTAILIMAFMSSADTIVEICELLIPLGISSFMVLPVPNHRNVWSLTAHIYQYYSKRRTYYWRGWCMTSGEQSSED